MQNGIVRPVDKMGRVVIPKELRNHLKVENDIDSFEIFLEGDKIVMKKFQPTCIFCNKLGPSVAYGEYTVCKDCIERLNEAKEHIK